MRNFIIIAFIFLLTDLCYSSDWKNVYSGNDSISAFVYSNDKLLLFNLGGKINEVNLNDLSSRLINTQNRWIFSASKNDNDIYISVMYPNGQNPAILKSTDNGENWFDFITDFGNEIFFASSCVFSGRDTCIFAGSDAKQNGSITLTHSGGTTKSFIKLKNTTILNTISKAKDVLFVGSGNGKILKSSDFGLTWLEVEYFNQENNSAIRNITFNDNVGIVSNQKGDIFKSLDFGQNWQKVNSGLSGSYGFYHTTFIGKKMIISGKNNSTNKGILILSEDEGINWKILFEEDQGFRGTFLFKDYIYCVSHNRNLWRAESTIVSILEKYFKNSNCSIIANNRIVNLSLYINEGLNQIIKLTDIEGNKVENDNYMILSNKPLTIIFKDILPSGIYFLTIQTGQKQTNVKILII